MGNKAPIEPPDILLGFAGILREWPHWGHMTFKGRRVVLPPLETTIAEMNANGMDIHLVDLHELTMLWLSDEQEYFNLFVELKASRLYNYIVVSDRPEPFLMFALIHRELIKSTGVGLEKLTGEVAQFREYLTREI